MFVGGFRPSSHEGHQNAFACLRAIVENDRKAQIEYFDRMRVKRHQAVYEAPGHVTRTEAERLIEQARNFVDWVKLEVTA